MESQLLKATGCIAPKSVNESQDRQLAQRKKIDEKMLFIKYIILL